MPKVQDKGEKKRGKVFVDRRDAALELARFIGEAQEEKSNEKAEKHHQYERAKAAHVTSARTAVRKHRGSTGKERLKEVKATILADRAKMKKEKARLRKERKSVTTGSSKPAQPQTRSDSKPPSTIRIHNDDSSRSCPRKRVAFA